MTFATPDPVMITVRKDPPEVIFRSRRPVVWPELMAHAARTELAFRSVTAVAIGMCLYADRDRLAGPGRIVASRTPFRRPPRAVVMRCMVEPHIKTLYELCRECLHGRIAALCVGVANGTHRLFVAVRELIQMAADTRFVTAKLAHDGFAGTRMAGVARELLVLRYLMREILKIPCRRSLRNWIWRVG